MNVDIDFGKIVMGFIAFIFTMFINRNVKRMDDIGEKLDRVTIELAELKGSITGRFVIDDKEHKRS